MRKIIIAVLLLVCYSVVTAQQTPQYTQYMYNMSAVNPGYVYDNPEVISTGLLYRKQWVNIDGSPSTANVFINKPFGDKIEVSLNYINDRIGDAINVKNDFVNLDFAYKLKLSKTFNMSYGVKLGLDSYRINALDSNVADDQAFGGNLSTIQMNFGVGGFLFSDNFYAGLSSPNLLPNRAKLGSLTVSQDELIVYGIAGYVYDVSENVLLKPSAVFKQSIGAPLSFDLSFNSLLFKRFEAGVSYRYQESFSGLVGFRVTKDLRIGYAYDFPFNNLNTTSAGSHEIMLLFDFDLLKTGNNFSSPRFY